MTARTTLMIVAVAALVGWFANDAFTEDPKPPTEQEMWAKMGELGQPGEPHKHLARLAGDWTAESTMYSSMGEMKAEATAKNEVVHGGRYIEMSYDSEFMGQPFTGSGFVGYDNFQKQYQMLWVDSMGSAMTFATGTCSADNSVLTFKYTMPSPWGDFDARMVYTFKTADEVLLEMYSKMKGGEEKKDMTIVYTRKK